MGTNRVRHGPNGEFLTDAEHALAIPTANHYNSTRPHFETQEEMTTAMKDPRYKDDPGYRHKVMQMIAASDAVALGLEQRSRIDDSGDKLDAVKDFVLQQFADPRYKTSALYREQLKELIRRDPATDMFYQPLPGVQRYEVEPNIPGPNAPPAKPSFNPDNVGNEE